MSEGKKFNPVEAGSDPSGYTVELNQDGKAVGELSRCVNEGTVIWKWQVRIDDAAVANGAAFRLSKAKTDVLFAWRGLRPLIPTVRRAKRRPLSSPFDKAGPS
jgi:hypothetical protein